MSQENVELVKVLYGAFGRRDLAAIFSRVSPEIRVEQSGELPWGGVYRGHEGLRSFLTNLMTHLDNAALPIERYLDAGDHVVAIGRTQGTVRANGKAFDVPLVHVWTVEGGVATGFRPFVDHPTMVAAMG
jgi:ketosteroid isomerase-like protein